MLPNMDVVEISSYFGLLALGLLTGNICLGLLLSTRYDPLHRWPYRSVPLFKIHNWTGYIALVVVLVHPVLLLFSKTAGFKLIDLLFPIHSPSQPTENTIGALALYALIVVVATSYFRQKFGFRVWKAIHYTSYFSAAALFTHGLLTDPNLKNTPFDPLDAEKLFVELCALLVVSGVGLRIRYGIESKKLKQNASLLRKFYNLKILEIKQETKDAVSIVFEIPENLKKIFQYRPGQYVTLRPILGGERIPRSYSFSSSPDVDSYYQVTVKRSPGGRVSSFLVNDLRPGDEIEVFPPIGNFTPVLRRNHFTHYLLIGGGSGITPLFSIAKSVLFRELKSRVTLLYGNRTNDDIIFKHEINELQRKFPDRFQVVYVLSEGTVESGQLSGLLNRQLQESLIRKLGILEPLKSLKVFICGPGPMMDESRATLLNLEIPPNQIHFELFTQTPKRQEVGSVETGLKPTVSSQIHAKVGGVSYEVISEAQESILAACIRLKVNAPYSCQIGSCSTCRAKVLSGEVRMDRADGLTQNEIDLGYVLTCQAHAITPKVEIDYDQ